MKEAVANAKRKVRRKESRRRESWPSTFQRRYDEARSRRHEEVVLSIKRPKAIQKTSKKEPTRGRRRVKSFGHRLVKEKENQEGD